MRHRFPYSTCSSSHWHAVNVEDVVDNRDAARSTDWWQVLNNLWWNFKALPIFTKTQRMNGLEEILAGKNLLWSGGKGVYPVSSIVPKLTAMRRSLYIWKKSDHSSQPTCWILHRSTILEDLVILNTPCGSLAVCNKGLTTCAHCVGLETANLLIYFSVLLSVLQQSTCQHMFLMFIPFLLANGFNAHVHTLDEN